MFPCCVFLYLVVFTCICCVYLYYNRGPVYCVAVHPTGTLALTVGKDKTVR